MGSSNGGRARILDRIRKAPFAADPAVDNVALDVAQIFPPIAKPLERFLVECAGNLTQVRQTQDAVESAKALTEIVRTVESGVVWVQDAPALRRFADAFAGRTMMWSSAGPPPEDCAATVTLCEGLVAQTGSIVSSSLCGGRGGSIIAPTHIVYATTDQLAPDIGSALHKAMAGAAGNASYVGLISGSSRTADIEKILVQGAHGPVKVALILESR